VIANGLQLIELEGFTILEKKQVLLTAQNAEEFYREHKGKPFYDKLVSFMTSGPILAMLLNAENAITKWRTLMGPTDSLKARQSASSSLRALYGTGRNASQCLPLYLLLSYVSPGSSIRQGITVRARIVVLSLIITCIRHLQQCSWQLKPCRNCDTSISSDKND
jgi:nucleoside diphosphate kinase